MAPPDRWQRLSAIFDAAMALEPGARDAFVRRECGGDEALRRDVMSLVTSPDSAAAFLSKPPVGVGVMSGGTSGNQTGTPTLAPGDAIGSYHIEELLGRGGMGEVYRALDTRLGREVAIKILPRAFTSDPVRLGRFESEARVLATLNHPHIGAIYGIEERDGFRALVLELVEGRTLETMVPLRLADALSIARQIADALDVAHERGIVHRDLKPANVAVTADGTVKVLDFGLAKILDDAPGSVRTVVTSHARTADGLILGTAAYMSPEQARGHTVDKRTDIWAFGCVVYEMLAGRPVFQSETVSDLLAAILERDPDWTALPPDTPAGVRRLLARCLDKDPRRRLRDIGDARLELDSSSSKEFVAPRPNTPRRRLLWLTALIATAVVAAVMPWDRPEPASRETRLEISTPRASQPSVFAISPDGRRLVFEARRGDQSVLWLRELNATSARPLDGTDNAVNVFWSPDGRSIGFAALPGTPYTLRRLDIETGVTQDLTGTWVAGGGTWNSSDTILYGQHLRSGLYRVPASGGEATPVTKLGPGMRNHTHPQFLPDGRHFVFYCDGSQDVRGVYLGSLDRPDVKRLSDVQTAVRVVPPDRLLVVRRDSLVMHRLDVSEGTLSADWVVVAGGMNYSPPRSLSVSVSANGLILYRPGTVTRRQLVWFDRTGRSLGTLGEANGTLGDPALSPDGQRVAVNQLLQANSDIWVIDALRPTTKLTFGPARDRFPLWSPDGSRIAFVKGATVAAGAYLKPSSDPAATEELLLGEDIAGLTDWSRDGRFILFDWGTPETLVDVWVLPLNGAPPSAGSRPANEGVEGRTPYPFANTEYAERLARFSPRGDWVAYQSNETGRAEIYVRSFPGPGGLARVSIDGGAQPRWRDDGKELYFIAPDARLMAAGIEVKGSDVIPRAPVALFQTRIYMGGTETPDRGQYDVARDGRFLVNTVVDETTPPIIVVQNWAADERR